MFNILRRRREKRCSQMIERIATSLEEFQSESGLSGFKIYKDYDGTGASDSWNNLRFLIVSNRGMLNFYAYWRGNKLHLSFSPTETSMKNLLELSKYHLQREFSCKRH
jgi:hypothetical protein